MKTSIKTFITLTIFVSISCLLVAFAFYSSQRERMDKRHIETYRSMISTMGNTLIEMEVFTERLMVSAIQHLKTVDEKRGLLSNADLSKLRDYLGVSDLFVTTKDGVYIRATNKPIPPDQPNLFSFCADYRDLTYGNLELAKTPILISYPKGSGTYKFMMMANHNKTRILDVAMKLDFILRILQNVAKTYPELISIGLYTPSGDSLGEYSAVPSESSKDGFKIPVGDDLVETNEDNLIVWRRVKTQDEFCCECNIKSLSAANSKYFYVLKAKISRKALLAAIADLRETVMLICFWIIAAGVALSFIVSRWIVRNLATFVNNVEKYLDGKMSSQKVEVKANDEVGFLSKTFSQLLEKLEVSIRDKIENEKLKSLAKVAEERVRVASQVSHDIRSPLSALNIIMNSSSDLPEDKRIIARTAIQRINDIANSLLAKVKANDSDDFSESDPYMASSIIDSIVSEKRIQFRELIDVAIEADSSHTYGTFVNLNYSSFKRVISNLINNSVEALVEQKGSVDLKVYDYFYKVRIDIIDTGRGIPANIIERLGKESGLSFGKSELKNGSGTGLGLYHARQFIEKSGGTFKISSVEQKGTTVTLTLPKAPPPCWFVDEIKFQKNSTVVVLDDDQSIHNIWRDRFKLTGDGLKKINLVHFTSGEKFVEWHEANRERITVNLYLIDYELLNQRQTGLDIIERLNIHETSLLVTSRFEERTIRERCLKRGIKLLPKLLAGIVPIRLEEFGTVGNESNLNTQPRRGES